MLDAVDLLFDGSGHRVGDDRGAGSGIGCFDEDYGMESGARARRRTTCHEGSPYGKEQYQEGTGDSQ